MRRLSRASRRHAPHRPLRFALLGNARTRPRPRSDYMSTTLLTTYRVHATGFASSLIEGRLLETIPKAERGVASRGGRLVTARPGQRRIRQRRLGGSRRAGEHRYGAREAREVARQALRPGCEELAARSRRQLPAVLGRRAAGGDGSAAPGEKSPRWSADASRVMANCT